MLALALGSALFAAMAAGLFVPLEAWFPRSRPRGEWRAVAACLLLFALNTQAMGLLGEPLLESLVSFQPGPLWLRVIAALVLGDLLAYGLHRAMHAVPWLWALHRMHHAPGQLRFWDGWRLHPVDFVAHGLCVGVPAVLLGVPLADFVGLVLLRKAFTLYLHADLPFRHGRFSMWLASPAWHAVHHDADHAGGAANFATTFPFVDRAFGTYRAPR